jgi:hypothetical protein
VLLWLITPLKVYLTFFASALLKEFIPEVKTPVKHTPFLMMRIIASRGHIQSDTGCEP